MVTSATEQLAALEERKGLMASSRNLSANTHVTGDCRSAFGYLVYIEYGYKFYQKVCT